MNKIRKIDKLILFTLVVFLQSASGGSNESDRIIPLVDPSNAIYGIGIRAKDVGSVAPITFFTKWRYPYVTDNYVVLDSQYALHIILCDTNCYLFSTVDEKSTHLILAYLSPQVSYDTIYTVANQSANNWLKNLFILDFSLRDSTFCGRFTEPYFGKIEVRKFVKRDSLSSIRIIETAYRQSISCDFKTIYFNCQTSLTPEHDTSYVAVYDIKRDSLYRLSSVTEKAWDASSVSHDTGVFYLGVKSGEVQLWKLMPDSTSTKLTDIVSPDSIFDYLLYLDHVGISVGSKGAEQASRFIRLDF